jgi:hypothetical protein
MRPLLAVAALLVAATPALAQFNVNAQFDPFRPDRAPLAASAEVPTIFLLGLDGVTPLFVNPARAARTDHRFVFGTVQGATFSPGAPVSLEGLFGSRDRRWLVSFENSVADSDASDVAEMTTVDVVDSGTTITRVQERLSDDANANVTTRARMLLVERTDFGGYAVGLFGGFRTATRLNLQDDDFLQTLDRTDPPSLQIRRSAGMDDREIRLDDFGVGLEAAFAGKGWDLAANASYQRRQFDGQNQYELETVNERTDTFPDGSTFTTFDRRFAESVATLDAAPSGVDVNVLGTIRSGLSHHDYFFGSATATVATGTATFALRTSEEISMLTNGEGTTTSSASEGTGEADLGTDDVKVSLGYVHVQKRRGLTVLAAVNPSAEFQRTDFVGVRTTGVLSATRSETEQVSLALDLPLHFEAAVSRRLAVFGGGVYRYAYTQSDDQTRPAPIDLEEEGPGNEEAESRTRSSDTFSSDTRLYGGALLRLRSGLTAQAAFRGDLAQFSGWTVSLGYRF